MYKLLFKEVRLFFLFFFIMSECLSQSVQRSCVVSGAGSIQAGLSIQSNIAELFVPTFSTVNTIISQGFLQNNIQVVTHSINSESSGAIILYPNPCSDLLFVEIGQEFLNESIASIELYNVLGEQQAVDILSYASDRGMKVSLDLSKLVAGVYFIKIYSKDNSIYKTLKLTKI